MTNPDDVVSISDKRVIKTPKGKIICALFHLFLWQKPPHDPIRTPTIICVRSSGRGDMPMGFNKPKIK